jgi:hypothetical protein
MKKLKTRKVKARSVTEDVRRPRTDELFGFLAGEVKIIGDIESPIVSVQNVHQTPRRRKPSRALS